jgi:hypothetical protein
MNHAFESALGVLGTAVPLITFAFGLVFCMLNRSFMPMIGAVVLSTAAHVVFGVVIPEREPRVSLAEAVTEAVNNSLKFDRTRGLFDDLRVPASQRDYILGQMTVIAARKTPSPVEHDMADLVKRAGDGFVNLGEAGMSWSVLYKMEREAFGEARSETAKAYADRVQQMRDARAPVVVGAGVIALFGISGALCLALLANRMRRRAKRIEGLFRDVRAMQDNFARDSAQSI